MIGQYPFYKKARDLFLKTQLTQIVKGLHKYEEPFNPKSWTPDQLLNHALEEAVDLTHYLVGLKDLLDEKDKEIARKDAEIARLQRILKDKQDIRVFFRLDE